MKGFLEFKEKSSALKDLETLLSVVEKHSAILVSRFSKELRRIKEAHQTLDNLISSFGFKKKEKTSFQDFNVALLVGGDKALVGNLWEDLAFSFGQEVKGKSLGVVGLKLAEKLKGLDIIFVKSLKEAILSPTAVLKFFNKERALGEKLVIFYPQRKGILEFKKAKIELGSFTFLKPDPFSFYIFEPSLKSVLKNITLLYERLSLFLVLFETALLEAEFRALRAEESKEAIKREEKKLRMLFLKTKRHILTKEETLSLFSLKLKNKKKK